MNAWQRICHVETERVNVFQASGAICCVVEIPAGRRQEDGPAGKWQKGESERSESGDVHDQGERSGDSLLLCGGPAQMPMLQSPVGSRVTHMKQAQFVQILIHSVCLFVCKADVNPVAKIKIISTISN